MKRLIAATIVTFVIAACAVEGPTPSQRPSAVSPSLPSGEAPVATMSTPAPAPSPSGAAPSGAIDSQGAAAETAKRLTSIAGPWVVGVTTRGRYADLWEGSTSDLSGQGTAARSALADVIVWRVDLSGPSGWEQLYIEASDSKLVATITQGH